ncbi:MAG: T9SS type A sorting domain-containing protein [Bacteroidota bacterium]
MKILSFSTPRFIRLLLLILSCLGTTASYSQSLQEIDKWVASDRGAWDLMGASVAVSGAFAIVGAPRKWGAGNTPAGAAYVYELNRQGQWTEVQKLQSTDLSWFDDFGGAVAISGEYAVVGARGADRDAIGNNLLSNAGAVYVFKRDRSGVWQQLQKIVAKQRIEEAKFGESIYFQDDVLMIGAPNSREQYNGTTYSQVGAVYAFELNASGIWEEQQKLIPPTIERFFGTAISVSGDRMVIGTPGVSSSIGRAFLYERDGNGQWSGAEVILASDGEGGDQFGRQVAIAGDFAVIGSALHDKGTSGQIDMPEAGAAYVFRRNVSGGWTEVQKLVASDRDTMDRFGASVAMVDDLLLVGAKLKNGATYGNLITQAGGAYLFQKNTNTQLWEEIQVMEASDKQGQAEFGQAVFLDRHAAIIGAQQEGRNASGGDSLLDAGAAYLFSTCTPSISVDVHLENDSLTWINGQTYYSDNQSAVHVTTSSTACDSVIFLDLTVSNGVGSELFQEVKEFVATDGRTGDRLGESVAISGNYAIAGSLSDTDENGENFLSQAGGIYFYERNLSGNWEAVQKVVASDRQEDAYIGGEVAIEGNYAVAGSSLADEDANGENTLLNAGAVYIFERDECTGLWKEIQKIVPSDRAANDRFGEDVAMYGDYIVIGASLRQEIPAGGGSPAMTGAAYVFKRNEDGRWVELQKLSASDRAFRDEFGQLVAISRDYIAIAAPGEDQGPSGGNTVSEAGSVYLFRNNGNDTWIEVQKIVASDRGSSDRLGTYLDMTDQYLVAGAAFEDHDLAGNNFEAAAGAAYVFELNAMDQWVEVQKLVASDREERDLFGLSVAIDGEVIIIGSPNDETDENGANPISSAGSIYVFERETNGRWTEKQKIVPTNRGASRFGTGTAICGNSIMVGGSQDASFTGKTFFFERCPSSIPSLTDERVACDSLTWIDGITYYSSNNVATHTVVNEAGCISRIQLRLTIIEASESVSVMATDSSFCFDGTAATLASSRGKFIEWFDNPSLQTATAVGNTFQTDQSAPGSYTYFLTDSMPGCPRQISDTVLVRIYDLPDVDLGGTQAICDNETVQLNGGAFTAYQWSTGATSASIDVNTAGTYGLTVTDANACEGTGEVLLLVNDLPDVNLGNDTTICASESLILSPGDFVSFQYLWNTGATTSSITVNSASTYEVTVTDGNGCQNTDQLVLDIYDLPMVELVDDATICTGDSLILSAGDFVEYLWSTNASSSEIVVTTAGEYRVTITDGNGCQNSDQFNLSIRELPIIGLDESGAFCISDSLLLDPGDFSTYQWSTGATSPSITVDSVGEYAVTVTDDLGCRNSATIAVSVNDLPEIDWEDAAVFCPLDSLQVGQFASYLWSNGESGASIVLTEEGEYGVTVTDANGCQNSASIQISLLPIDEVEDVQTSCEEFTWIDGVTYTESNKTAVYTLSNVNGCDSIISLDLTIQSIDLGITQMNDTLTAVQENVSYQWINCADKSILPGQTDRQFVATEEGEYAVVIDNGSCVDTSACISIVRSSTVDVQFEESVRLYPNPTEGVSTIEFEKVQEQVSVRVWSVVDQLVAAYHVQNAKTIPLQMEAAAGIYFVELTNLKGQRLVLRLVKQ